jgi:site-specific DNA-methyltransferase (adenine-specific)
MIKGFWFFFSKKNTLSSRHRAWKKMNFEPSAARFVQGRHILLHGDCLTLLRAMEAESFDVIVTSPPYNLDLAYTAYDDRRSEADYLEWMVEAAAACKRVLKPEGSFFLNVAGSNSNPWLPLELIVRLRKIFVLQNHITWIKSVALPKDSVGHYKPIGGARFLTHNHEHIFHLTHTGSVKLDRLAIGVPFKDKSNIARRGHLQDKRCRGNTWFIPYRTVQTKAEKYNHPGPFPVDLPRWCIRLHGVKGAWVLDPFAGSGTTLVAAELEGAAATGIDIDAAYLRVAAERLAEMRATVL